MYNMVRLALLLLCFLTASPAFSETTVILNWNPNTESDLAGYKIYQSTISGQYGAPVVTLGKVTTTTLALPQLTVDATYFFVLTAYDLAGNESGKSVEVMKLVSGVPLPVTLPTPTNFIATTLADGRTQLSWDDMQLPAGTGYLLRVHLEGTPMDPCSTIVFCGDVFFTNSMTFDLPPGNYDAWIHSARSASEWGTSAPLVFTVVPPVDLPPAPPTGFALQVSRNEIGDIIITAKTSDCPRVLTSTAGSTVLVSRRTVRSPMPILSSGDRATLWGDLMRLASDRCDALALTKPYLLAAVQATDDWASANVASFNVALPLPARTALTGRQKAELLMFVIRRRWETF